jgi:hypothetical protein
MAPLSAHDEGLTADISEELPLNLNVDILLILAGPP